MSVSRPSIYLDDLIKTLNQIKMLFLFHTSLVFIHEIYFYNTIYVTPKRGRTLLKNYSLSLSVRRTKFHQNWFCSSIETVEQPENSSCVGNTVRTYIITLHKK